MNHLIKYFILWMPHFIKGSSIWLSLSWWEMLKQPLLNVLVVHLSIPLCNCKSHCVCCGPSKGLKIKYDILVTIVAKMTKYPNFAEHPTHNPVFESTAHFKCQGKSDVRKFESNKFSDLIQLNYEKKLLNYWTVSVNSMYDPESPKVKTPLSAYSERLIDERLTEQVLNI